MLTIPNVSVAKNVLEYARNMKLDLVNKANDSLFDILYTKVDSIHIIDDTVNRLFFLIVKCQTEPFSLKNWRFSPTFHFFT